MKRKIDEKINIYFHCIACSFKTFEAIDKTGFTYEISHSHLVDHFVGSVPKQPLIPHNYQLFFLKHLAAIVH